ncbi:MAG: hypothetical protein AAF206_27805 [Bacteroidota bacterium]
MKKYIPHMIITAIVVAVVYLIIENRKRKKEIAPLLPISDAIREAEEKKEDVPAEKAQSPEAKKPPRKRDEKGKFVKENIIEDAEIAENQ